MEAHAWAVPVRSIVHKVDGVWEPEMFFSQGTLWISERDWNIYVQL